MPRDNMNWDECVGRLKSVRMYLKKRGSFWSRERLAVDKALALINRERYSIIKKEEKNGSEKEESVAAADVDPVAGEHR